MTLKIPELENVPLSPLGWLSLALMLGFMFSLVLSAWAANVYGGVPAVAFFPVGIGASVPLWFSVWGAFTDALLILGVLLLVVAVAQAKRRVEELSRLRRARSEQHRELWDPPSEPD